MTFNFYFLCCEMYIQLHTQLTQKLSTFNNETFFCDKHGQGFNVKDKKLIHDYGRKCLNLIIIPSVEPGKTWSQDRLDENW